MWHIFASCIGSASMGNVAQPYMGYGTLEHPAALTSGREPGGAPGRRRRTACPRRTRRTRAPASRSAAPWPGTSGRRARRTSRRPAPPPARAAARSRPARVCRAARRWCCHNPQPVALGRGCSGEAPPQMGAASRTLRRQGAMAAATAPSQVAALWAVTASAAVFCPSSTMSALRSPPLQAPHSDCVRVPS